MASVDLDSSLSSLAWLTHVQSSAEAMTATARNAAASKNNNSTSGQRGSNKRLSNRARSTSTDSAMDSDELEFPEQDADSRMSTPDVDRALDVDWSEEARCKPPFSYATLIFMAMQQADKPKLALSEIYDFIVNNFAWYRMADPGWKNSIRHNLSQEKAFIKVDRGSSERGKGGYWALNPEYKNFDQLATKKRRRYRNRSGAPLNGKPRRDRDRDNRNHHPRRLNPEPAHAGSPKLRHHGLRRDSGGSVDSAGRPANSSRPHSAGSATSDGFAGVDISAGLGDPTLSNTPLLQQSESRNMLKELERELLQQDLPVPSTPEPSSLLSSELDLSLTGTRCVLHNPPAELDDLEWRMGLTSSFATLMDVTSDHVSNRLGHRLPSDMAYGMGVGMDDASASLAQRAAATAPSLFDPADPRGTLFVPPSPRPGFEDDIDLSDAPMPSDWISA